MNNTVLQKLIHGYQLINVKDFATPVDNIEFGSSADVGDDIGTPFAREWENTFGLPRHIFDKVRGKFAPDGTPLSAVVPPHLMYQTMRQLSQDITQAMKFSLDMSDKDDWLTPKEVEAVLPETPIYSPYPQCYLQLEMPEAILCILCKDHGEVTKDTGEAMLSFQMFVYDKKDGTFTLDANIYNICFHGGDKLAIDGRTGEQDLGGYTYWIADTWFKEITDTNGHPSDYSRQDQFSNESLNSWVHTIQSTWCTFCIYMNYPQIAEQRSVKGRTNEHWFDIPMRKHTTSEYRNKPKFEHKELIIKMYETASGTSNGVGRSSGTKFHSVRKHLRKLPTGKQTWVKAHFRGAKEHGVINKDYKVSTG